MTGNDFDWVSARTKCTVHAMFARLYQGVCEDLKIFSANNPGLAQRIESRECVKNERFYVERIKVHRVVFEIENETIKIEFWPIKGDSHLIMLLTVGLDDNGECILTDKDGNSWQFWQVRMKALEKTLF